MDILLGLAVTTHLGLAGSYNEYHPHVRLTQDNYIAGAYYNSIENLSVYAGRRWEYGDFGLEATLVTGYDDFSIITPMARATYDLSDNHTIFVAPAGENYNNVNKLGVVVGLEFTLNK